MTGDVAEEEEEQPPTVSAAATMATNNGENNQAMISPSAMVWNGVNVPEGSNQFVGVLYDKRYNGKCTASLSHPFWILTAAHCIHHPEETMSHLNYIILGTADIYKVPAILGLNRWDGWDRINETTAQDYGVTKRTFV